MDFPFVILRMIGPRKMAHPKTILITEDDVFNREILKEILASQGYNVLTAQSLTEMFSQMENSEKPDLLLLDLHLPDGSGLSVVDRIRREHHEIPIILITAAVTTDNEKLAGEKGVRKIISKPFTPSQIIEEVHKILA